MSLDQALRHVEKTEAETHECSDPIEYWSADPVPPALEQLIQAIADGELPARWVDEPWPSLVSCPSSCVFDDKAGESFWHDLHIVADGRVVYSRRFLRDQRGAPQVRNLFVLRAGVMDLWPESDQVGAAEPRRYASAQSIREIAAAVYARDRDNPPNITVAEQLVRSRLAEMNRRASRDAIRNILKEPEFASKRRQSGNQPKR
jgi:hypothetical protein